MQQKMIQLYNFRFTVGVPVTVHLIKDHKCRWTRIHGIQIGDWFIGAIKGRIITPDQQHDGSSNVS